MLWWRRARDPDSERNKQADHQPVRRQAQMREQAKRGKRQKGQRKEDQRPIAQPQAYSRTTTALAA